MKPIAIPFFALFLAGTSLTALAPQVSNARLETVSPDGGLEPALRQASRGGGTVWVGWSVPMIAGQRRFCCLDRDFKSAACHLEGKNQSWGGTDRDAPRQDQKLVVLARYQDGKAGRIRGFSEDCPLDAGGRRFVWLGAVQPEQSVAVLAGLATEDALSALALHRNANADTALEELASAPRPMKTREQALFWLGQTRGERGARFLEKVLRDDRDDDVREKVVFSLSQLPEGKGVRHLMRLGRESRDPQVRKEAFFWLAQSDDPEALKYLDKVLNDD